MLAAAASCACPLLTLEESRALLDERSQNGTPLDADRIRKLASEVAGNVITPGSLDYESARLVFNRAFDRRPAVIVRCSSPSDVARSLEFAQAEHLPLAVRSGGHSRLGYGMADGDLVIDLSSFKRVEIDAKKRIARAQAGALVRDLDGATQ
jgi:FAD/FMN-containing dehydrogenase